MNEEPYIIERVIKTIRHFNPNYPSDALCVCGHPYHRHFDGYEEEGHQDVGCKYCSCHTFEKRLEWVETRAWSHCDIYCDKECDYDLPEHKPDCACSTFEYGASITEKEHEKRNAELEKRRRKCWGDWK